MNKDNYIELPREKITFYGDTENEKKQNELLYDMGLELSALDDELKEKDKEIDRLNNIINECAEDILKELKENNHLSYGVALAIRQKLINYKELKENNK